MTPEFLRRYYIVKIISNPIAFGIQNDTYVSLRSLQNKLEEKQQEFDDKTFFRKLNAHNAKTIHRDLMIIMDDFGIEIKLKRNYGYYLNKGILSQNLEHLFMRVEQLLIAKKAIETSTYINAESTTLNTTIDTLGLINAIENKYLIYVTYKGWYEDNLFENIENKPYQPLCLKERDNDWYLLAFSLENKEIKTFCLDNRIQAIRIFKKKVVQPILFNADDYYKNSFGILPEGLNVQKIRIQVANHHLKYLLGKPLHKSQQLITEPKVWDTNLLDYSNPDIWGEIEVYLKPNYEFLMELLKYNQWVKVVSPNVVVDYYKTHLEAISAYYN